MKTNARRDFIRTLAGSAAALALSGNALAQTAPSATQLSPRIKLISGAGNNVVAVTGTGTTLLVDCGDAAHAADVLRLTGPVGKVINTHWHTEATGANDSVAKAGGSLVSHVNTRLWMTQEIIHEWEHRVYPPRAPEARPKETFYTTGKAVFEGEPVEYGLLPMAHTDGDIYVHFPQSNILVVGDVVQPGRLPFLDFTTGGWIGGMQAAQKTLLELADDQTKIVPGLGPVMSKSDLQANLATVTRLRDHLVKLMKQGKGPKDMIAGKAMGEFDGLTGDPDAFIFTAYRGMWGHVRELGGIL